MIKSYSLIKNKKRVLLCHIKGSNALIKYYIEQINETQEKSLDKIMNNKKLIFTNCENLIIPAENILAYGEFNINNKGDEKLIKKLNLVNTDGFTKYTKFNYENGTITSNKEGIIKIIFDSKDVIANFKQKHCELNKANRIIIYKEIVKYKYKKL